MSLEIRAALDASLQKEIAALRGFIGNTLDSHSERLQGDLAALLPATRTPRSRLAHRYAGAARLGRHHRLVPGAVRALPARRVMTWLWWQQGGEIAALRTDLAAAYAEVETLRARPE